MREALSRLTVSLLQRDWGLRDAEVRPRHRRMAASRLAMRMAVMGLLESRQRLPGAVGTVTNGGWRGWAEAARGLAGLLPDPLFEPACPSSPHPESRALAKLEEIWLDGIPQDVAPPDLRGVQHPEPAAFLGNLYQELLEATDSTGGSSRAHRKRIGSFYTGEELSRPTVERTLLPLTRRKGPESILGLRVCDPAMGTGPFLVSALHCLTDALWESLDRCSDLPDLDPPELLRMLRRQVATSSLWGVDVDPTAVDLARWSLCLEVDDPGMQTAELSGHFRCGDALIGCPPDREADPDTADRWTSDLFREPVAEHSHPHFFHWALEFPDVFSAGGFDVVVGNPPWETLQPNSKEFFGEMDLEYRSLGKQAALSRQHSVFSRDPAGETDWRLLRSRSRAFARYAKRRFHHQGSGKPYTYRLFLELAYELLRDGGRLGLILPSGLYTDLGSAPLRQLLLDQCRWEWLFCFENRAGLFDIDSRYRFGPVIVEKGGTTRRLKTAFLRHDPSEWQEASPPCVPYSTDQIHRLSPRHRALLDVRNGRDLEILDKIHENARPFLASAGGDMHFAQGDFNMTSDSGSFHDRVERETQGYRPDIFGRWLDAPAGSRGRGSPQDRWIPMADGGRVRERDVRRIALPLYQGAMIYDLHPSAAVHRQGSGHRTRWRRTETTCTALGPQFLVDLDLYRDLPALSRSPQLVLRALSNATNERTVVPGLVTDLPCGNSLVILRTIPADLLRTLYGTAIMSSLVYDWSMRQRMAGTNLNSFILEETVWPEAPPAVTREIAVMAARLALITPRDAPVWIDMLNGGWIPEATGWPRFLALRAAHRTRLHSMLDAIVATLFGLGTDDLAWVLRDCDHSPMALRDRGFTRTLDPKGFWRVHRDREPPLRRTTQALAAFRQLQREIAGGGGDPTRGILAFCSRHQALDRAPEGSWVQCEGYARLLGPFSLPEPPHSVRSSPRRP